jgi:hypothetical protein
MILSVCAAMAYPRLSGVYGQARYERLRRAISGLILRGERESRLRGVPLVVTWEEGTHRLALMLPRPWSPLTAATSRAVGQAGDEAKADAFLRFAFDNQVVDAVLAKRIARSNGELMGIEPPIALRRVPAGWSGSEKLEDLLLDEVRLEPDVELRPRGMPVLLTPDGRTSGASLVLTRGGISDECTIPAMGASTAWSRP